MNTIASNTYTGQQGIIPQNSSGVVFTADDVLAAYVKGKNYLSDEARTVLGRTIPLAIKRAPDAVNQIAQNSQIDVPSMYMKVNGLSIFDVLCIVKADDYLSSTKLRKAYVIASEIEETLFDNSFNFRFRFVMQSDLLNDKTILSEGYRPLPK
jgi:hypothetical protein